MQFQASEHALQHAKHIRFPTAWAAVDKNRVVVALFDEMSKARSWAKARGLTTTVVTLAELVPSTRVEVEMAYHSLRVGDLFRSAESRISDVTFRRVRGGAIFESSGRLVTSGIAGAERVVYIQE